MYTAAALEANGEGHLVSVDSRNFSRKWTHPTPDEFLASAGLSHRVTLDRRFSTYTWFLKTELERCGTGIGDVEPEYDFIFIDGPKNWTIDGLAVLLAEKLLRPGGWLLLDDLGWSFENFGKKARTSLHYTTQIDELSEAERTEPHLQAVFDLLLRGNPAFDTFEVHDDWWGWAHKAIKPGPSLRAARMIPQSIRHRIPLRIRKRLLRS